MKTGTIGTVILCLALCSCSGAKPPPPADIGQPGETPATMPPEVWAESTAGQADPAAVVKADNEFGFRLFLRLFQDKPLDNHFVSPTSIAMALAMTYNGAEGKTRGQMADALGLAGIGPGDVNMANAALLATLASADPKVTIEIANSLWVRQGIRLADRFTQVNRDYYDAEVASLDFRDAAAPGVINAWVKQKTHDKIDEIVTSIEPGDVLFLINAVYFKGRWTDEFTKELTQPQVFHAPGGDVEHPMMRQSGKYRYYAGEGLAAVRLPYGEGRFAMVVLLPDEGVGLGDFVARLTPANWRRWLDGMSMRDGDIVLPKFKLEYERTLNQVLSSLGMGVAFDPGRAEFDGMLAAAIDMPFYISEVLHKSYVDVNEEGTEAAAVTSVRMAMTAMPRDKFRMVVDRPFVFAIHDEKSDAVLFLGVVNEPEE